MRVVVNHTVIKYMCMRYGGMCHTDWFNKNMYKWLINKYDNVCEASESEINGLSDKQKEWVERGAKVVKVIIDVDLISKIDHMIDYMKADNLPEQLRIPNDISGISVEDMIKRSEAWSRWMQKKAMKIRSQEYPEDDDCIDVVKEWKDCKLVKIVNGSGLIREGELMGHCIGNTEYQQYVCDKKINVYSLRDNDNIPHVTYHASAQTKMIEDIQG